MISRDPTPSIAIVLPVAHFGHVLIDLPVFLGPVLIIGVWLLIALRKGKYDRDRELE